MKGLSMMLNNNKMLSAYLDTLIDSVFKILPLYEEENIGLEVYVESLLFELKGLSKAIKIEDSYEYISLLSTLESIKQEVVSEESEKSVIKREVFKSISTIKDFLEKIDDS